ncbi:Sensor histidine kinase RcsC [compost metagenome]
MDCDLPDTDGYTLAQTLRQREAERGGYTTTRIIAISAATGAAHAQRCAKAGMNGVISKPIRLAKLQDAIERWADVNPARTSDADTL